MAHLSAKKVNAAPGLTPPSDETGLVSVLLPAHNAARFIRETLESVLAQTYAQIEVLVIDDGSTDETVAIVKKIAASDARLLCFSQSNAGVAAARNFALEQARGEFVAPINADDIWFPRKLEKQVAALRANQDAALVYTWSVLLDEQGRLLDGCPVWDVEGDVLEALLYRNFLGHASVPLIRRAVLAKVGGYDASLRARDAQGCEDWDLYLRLAEGYPFCAVREYLVGYRQLRDSMSANFATMARSHELVMDAMRPRHPEIRAAVFRWSRGHFCQYLFAKSFRAGNFAEARRWYWAALRADAAILLSPQSCRMMLTSVTRLFFSPSGAKRVEKSLSVSQKLRAQFDQRWETLAEVTERKMRARFPWRPFTWLEVRRWLRVTGKPLPSFKAV